MYWRHRQHDFPTLARIARDLLAIPAAGVGVERLFNSSRDICHYRKRRLNPDTIRLLIIKLYITRFELAEDLRVIKAELPYESDSESDNDSDDDCDLDFRYISDNETDNLTEDINDNYDDNEIDNNGTNRSREPFSATSDNSQSTVYDSIKTKANGRY